ncbi:recombination-associated protein RdgC [Thermodesulforhabdus norvegica]|uniref:Putative exonuclease, RdgC n=1 Tax=Thermodesulforhabdus norvegica TaxID=39841 RepID=A0A1I4QLV3_9BACT|nr:recombination-associated protein RdgC [Thermodesulforhabdus norvegica]SFM41004.1 Putative exonuclease, RdgC [Thermodesulforhabdus norvegica]
MGIQSGAATITFFHVPDPITEDFWNYIDENLKAGIFSPCGEEDVRTSGFVSWSDLFSIDLDHGGYRKGEYIVFQFRIDEKKIPSMLLKQHLKEEKLRFTKERGRPPTRSEQKILKEAVEKKLIKLTFPIPRGCEVVWNPLSRELMLGTASSGVIEAFLAHFERYLKLFPVPQYHLKWALTMDDVPAQVKDSITKLVNPSSPTALKEGMFLGYEFLTWLWFRTEAYTNDVKVDDSRHGSIYLGDRITLGVPLEGTEKVTCTSKKHHLDEARVALASGKRPAEAQWFMQVADREYTFTLDASLWSIKSLKFYINTPPEGNDPDGIFFNRIFCIEEVRAFLRKLYGEFLNFRFTSSWQDDVLPELNRWIMNFRRGKPISELKNVDN